MQGNNTARYGLSEFLFLFIATTGDTDIVSFVLLEGALGDQIGGNYLC